MKLVALVLMAACTSFPAIERGVCGNGIVEPGEDCDSPEPSCVACAVACTTGSDCPNAAYTCGVDGLCHAPSGLFAQPTPQTLDLIDEMQIADIDRDGIGDVVGVSTTSLDVHYGDPSASLATSVEIATPQQTGTVAFGDIDGDGVPDATIITEDGIVAFTSPYAALSAAVSFLPLTDGSGNELDVLATFPIDSLAFGIVVAGSDAAAIVIEQIGDGSAALDPYCLVSTAEVTPDDLDSYTIAETDGSLNSLVVLWAKGSGGASSRQMCVTSMHLGAHTGSGIDPLGPRSVAFYNMTPAATPPPKRPAFAELDSTACPSLVQTDGSGTLTDYTGSLGAGYCQIASTAAALPALPAGADEATTVGHVPVQPNLIATANDLLVLGTGMYAYTLGQFYQVYKSERTITAVGTGDFNGDKTTDAALVAGGEADLEVLYRSDAGAVPGYVVAPFQTAGVVTSIAVGDFDGNGTSDIAYTEQLIGHVQLSVGFGEPGNNFTQQVEGAFSATSSMVPIDIADSNDPSSVISDLVVVEQLQTGEPALTLLHGNPERTMLSYFEPRTSADPSRETPMRQVVTGHFGGGSTQYLDIVSMLAAGGTTTTAPVVAYRLDGTSAGLDPTDPIDLVFGEQVADLEDCAVGDPSTGMSPCIRDATALAWSTGSDHDVIVGVDHQTPPQAFRVDPWMFAPKSNAQGSSMAMTLPVPTEMAGSGAVAHTAFAFDIDGDGSDELVLAFAPAQAADASGPGLVEACAMSASGVPTSCTDLGALVTAVAPGVQCVDAGAGVFAAAGPDVAAPAPGLILLCHDATGTSLLARVAAGSATVIATGLPPLRQIAVGDVTGDGVDDVVAIRGDSGDRALTVLVQCSSRDLACQNAAVAP
ncbi:MAG TPA: VCBS repeat-containing protein [Kofleriaceae bacterium]|jgi:hypothetical protein|nr:VCBS repeat-containing protein [Kofleriaceae bacterium]